MSWSNPNPIKFRIEGRTPEIVVTSEMVEKTWRVSVSDNGAGLIPGQIGRVLGQR